MIKKHFTKKRVVMILLFLFVIAPIFSYWQNNSIVVTRVEYKNPKIPVSFNGFKIMQVSDLHNKSFGEGQDKLIKKIKENVPDMIAITGDLIDSRSDTEAAIEFIKEAVKIAPVYFVSGNHEQWAGKYIEFAAMLKQLGVILADDSSLIIKRNGESIALIGLKDPASIHYDYLEDNIDNILQERLEKLSAQASSGFKLLLSHRPEKLELYAKTGFDFVLSGHAHGGQMRIPFIGGLVAPDQGFFPKYTSGLYQYSNTTMIVSRGLGNSIIPVRVFNRPELILVTLHN